MGGVFDPIHYGHLMTAEIAFHEFDMEKVIFVPAGNPPHKEVPVASSVERFEMTAIAIADNAHFEVSRTEVDRKKISYTVDTLKEMKKTNPGANLYFITGADAILELPTWENPVEVTKLATFVAATRPGYSLEKIDMIVERLKGGLEIKFIEVPSLAISSSDIRSRIAAGRPVRYLLPDEVRAYIYKKDFYRKNRNDG